MSDTDDQLRRPSRRLTFDDAVEIHRQIRRGEFLHRIAARFGVNPGRVAEIKKGEKFPGSREAAIGAGIQPTLI